MEVARFHLRYQTWSAWKRDCDQQIGLRGLLLRTPVELDQFSSISVQLVAPDRQSFELRGEVVQVIPGRGLAVQFATESQATIERILTLRNDRTSDAQQPADDDDPTVLGPGQPTPPPNQASPDVSLPKAIENMTVNEKRRAALHGRRDMRLLLIRDRNKTIHPFVLRNPAITLDEVQQIAKMPSVNPEVLRMIASNREWLRSMTICRNLVRNPKTPLRDALSLLDRLPMSELRALAKSGNVRTPIQQAARKRVIG